MSDRRPSPRVAAAPCSPAARALQFLQGKWKLSILEALQEGPTRLGELRRKLPAASKKVLAATLRKMEQHRLIVRRDLGGRVPHVEYVLEEVTRAGLKELLHALGHWANRVEDSARQSPNDDPKARCY